MRNLFITLVIIFAFTSVTLAQVRYPGFAVGTNIANLTGDSTSLNNKSPRIGAYFSIFWDVYINQETYIQVGIAYSQQGATFYSEYYHNGLFYKDQIVNRIDYIQIPVLWKQRWSNVYTELGGYLAVIPIKPSSQWTQSVYYPDSIHTISGTYQSFVDNINLFDIGPIFGIGYQAKISPQFDGFFNISFKPGLIRLNRVYTRPEYQMYNQVFNFTVGLISIGRAARHDRFVTKRRKR